MIPITKAEAMAIRENLPSVHIVRTMKQKSKRGHYYCDNAAQALRFLTEFRNEKTIEKKAGVEDRYSKKDKRV